VVKLRNGEYTPLNLHIDVDQMLEMRASIIKHTAEMFDPDIFIVDKEPLGLKREVLPAALRFQGELGQAASATAAAGVACSDTKAQLKAVVDLIAQLRAAIAAVEKAETQHFESSEKHARHIRDKLLPAMVEARRVSDTLEELIPDDVWPLPRYAEMLFVR